MNKLLIGLIISLATLTPFKANASPDVVYPINDIRMNYSDLESEIEIRTNLNVDLPEELRPSSDYPIYYVVNTASENEYSINIEVAPNCKGAGACSIQSWSAKKGNHLPLKSDYSYKNPYYPDVNSYQYVKLNNGYQAVVVHGCGAYCTGGISWLVNGTTYSIYGKTGVDSKKTADYFVEIANSIYQ